MGQVLVDSDGDETIRFDPSPDEELLAWRDVHEGETVCIVANGESANKVRLGQINCKTIALNRAWMLPRSFTYYCMGDAEQFRAYARERGDIRKLRPLFATQMGPAHATRFRGLPNKDQRAFNLNLLEGVWLGNTICSFGIHLSIWMGFRTIYLIGVDATGRHFYGGPPLPAEKAANQREQYGYIAGFLAMARPNVQIINLNMNSPIFAFRKQRFETVFG